MSSALLRPFPLAVVAAAAACAGVIGFTASAGIRDDMVIASVVAMAGALGTAAALALRPGFADLVERTPALPRALFVVGSLGVAVQLAWLTPFIIDVHHTGDLAGDPRARYHAESVHGDLRVLPRDVARRAGRAARLASVALGRGPSSFAGARWRSASVRSASRRR